MTNQLAHLLATPTVQRSVADYEGVFDDFVAFAGGARITATFTVPDGTCNADYHFECEQYELVLELKQINAYDAGKTVDEYFTKLLSEGRVKHYTALPDGRTHIEPSSLSKQEWRKFYKHEGFTRLTLE
jgi:hypothetical protein